MSRIPGDAPLMSARSLVTMEGNRLVLDLPATLGMPCWVVLPASEPRRRRCPCCRGKGWTALTDRFGVVHQRCQCPTCEGRCDVPDRRPTPSKVRMGQLAGIRLSGGSTERVVIILLVEIAGLTNSLFLRPERVHATEALAKRRVELVCE